MSAIYLTRSLKIFVLVYSISRFFLLFIPASLPDIPYVSMSVNTAIFGRDLPYPPLFQLQLALFLYLLGPNLVGYRLGLTIYEVGCLIILYKFAYQLQKKEFQKPEQMAKSSALKIVYVFAFFPNTIFNYSGSVEFIATFFMLLGLLAYYQDKVMQASIFLGLGVLMEIYPIFCLIPIIIHQIVRKQFRPLFKFSSVFILTFLLGNLPFYLLNPTDFFSNYFIQFSRVPRAESLWEIPYNLGIDWNLIVIGNFLIISPIGIGFLIWFLTFVIFSYIYFLKYNRASKKEELAVIAVFMLLLPLVFLSLFPRYIFFGFPIVCLLYETSQKYNQLIVRARNFTTVIIISAIITLTFWSEIVISTVQQEILVLDNLMLYFFLFYGMYLLISIIWLISPQELHILLGLDSKIYRNLILAFAAFFVQVFLITGPIQFLISRFNDNGFLLNLIMLLCFGLGFLPVIWNIKFILKAYLFKPGTEKLDKRI